MSPGVEVIAVRDNLPRLNAMLAVVDACAAAGVSYPAEVVDYFGDALQQYGPDAARLRAALERVALPVGGDVTSADGVLVRLADLPEGTTALQIRAVLEQLTAEPAAAEQAPAAKAAVEQLEAESAIPSPSDQVLGLEESDSSAELPAGETAAEPESRVAEPSAEDAEEPLRLADDADAASSPVAAPAPVHPETPPLEQPQSDVSFQEEEPTLRLRDEDTSSLGVTEPSEQESDSPRVETPDERSIEDENDLLDLDEDLLRMEPESVAEREQPGRETGADQQEDQLALADDAELQLEDEGSDLELQSLPEDDRETGEHLVSYAAAVDDEAQLDKPGPMDDLDEDLSFGEDDLLDLEDLVDLDSESGPEQTDGEDEEADLDAAEDIDTLVLGIEGDPSELADSDLLQSEQDREKAEGDTHGPEDPKLIKKDEMARRKTSSDNSGGNRHTRPES